MPSRMGQQLRGRSFLKRTPQALQRVRGPSGPHRHCGVWWHPQLRHTVRRPLRAAAAATGRRRVSRRAEEAVQEQAWYGSALWVLSQQITHWRCWARLPRAGCMRCIGVQQPDIALQGCRGHSPLADTVALRDPLLPLLPTSPLDTSAPPTLPRESLDSLQAGGRRGGIRGSRQSGQKPGGPLTSRHELTCHGRL